MLTVINITLDKTENEFVDFDLLPALQGVLMEQIKPELANKLHEQKLHPYSQYMMIRENAVIWRIAILNDSFGDEFVNKLESLKEVDIRNQRKQYPIRSVEKYYLDYSALVEKYYFGENSRYIKIRFLTPTSFKQNGSYVIFPTIHLIFQSLMTKYDSAAEESTVFDRTVLEHFEENAYISRYKLRSTLFRIGSAKIPSFIGEITLKLNGPRQMVNLAWLLLKFGTFSGVGIKTGMGMGAVKLEEKGEKE